MPKALQGCDSCATEERQRAFEAVTDGRREAGERIEQRCERGAEVAASAGSLSKMLEKVICHPSVRAERQKWQMLHPDFNLILKDSPQALLLQVPVLKNVENINFSP